MGRQVGTWHWRSSRRSAGWRLPGGCLTWPRIGPRPRAPRRRSQQSSRRPPRRRHREGSRRRYAGGYSSPACGGTAPARPHQVARQPIWRNDKNTVAVGDGPVYPVFFRNAADGGLAQGLVGVLGRPQTTWRRGDRARPRLGAPEDRVRSRTVTRRWMWSRCLIPLPPGTPTAKATGGSRCSALVSAATGSRSTLRGSARSW